MRISILGCGIIGALLAYELGRGGQHSVVVLEQADQPAAASTGAALGVLMGVISHKLKGRPWRLRQASLERYEQLIPELEAATGLTIPFNRQGLLKLLFAEDDRDRWQCVIEHRQHQGYELQWLDPEAIAPRVPGLDPAAIVGGIYSPQDRQVDPTRLTQALVQAARQQGVEFHFNCPAQQVLTVGDCATGVVTESSTLPTDCLIITAGTGSFPLTQALNQPLPIQPVLGQAVEIRLPHALLVSPEPVLTGRDIHFVPLGDRRYWFGATVELPSGFSPESPREPVWRDLWQAAQVFCPLLKEAEVLRHWQGWRPRPVGRSAPVIERLAGYTNVVMATAHYRNGVLLAPATAQVVQQLLDHG